MVNTDNHWFHKIIDEMVEQGLVEEVEPNVIQKIGGHGKKLDYGQFVSNLPDDRLSKSETDSFKVILLALMEAPEVMGTPIDPDDLPDWFLRSR